MKQHGLTDRQFEVARLVADGLTDKQIGVALTISAETVGFHVMRIAKAWHLRDGGRNIRVQIANRIREAA